MVCGTTCLLGAAFVGSMLFCMISTKDANVFKNFESLLDANQVKNYKEIANERLNIYLQGFFIGLVLAVLSLNFVRQLKKMPVANKVCLFITIALGFNYLYYILFPKSKYMLESLTTPEQVKAWLKIYRHMQLRVKSGVVLGLIGYILFAYGMC
tara:strand:- start:165 stop:626 length:462 start_codon:yes stop_codon:yes gene_type:complete